MKSKYCFTLAVVLIILFSLGCVAAGDNITSDDVCLATDSEGSVDEEITLEIDENQEALNDASSNDNVDLSVDITVEDVYVGNKFNQAGSIVPWNITVTANNGTAHNTKVQITLTDNMELVSYNKTKGTFNSKTGIWDIGELTSSDDAILSIFTKLKVNGRFKCTADATTTSNDIDSSNNDLTTTIRNGTGKSTSNTTEESGDKEGAQHGDHQFSGGDARAGVRQREESQNATSQYTQINSEENKKSTEGSSNTKSESNGDSDGEAGSNSKTKSVSKSSINVASNAFEYLASIFNPASASKEVNVNNSLSAEVVEALKPYDYTKIPILIFSAFLVLLVAIVGYDKIKS